MFKLFMKNRKGFTLVELMVVVVILGILTAIAVPVYNSVQEAAIENTIAANVRIIDGAIVLYHANNDIQDPLNISELKNFLVPDYIKFWPEGPGDVKYSIVNDVVVIDNYK